jgi:ADP-ribosyl-[dinitrogen reductase] hydrolase
MFHPPLRHRFLLGCGMVSDDTEHACLTAVALAKSSGDGEKFARYMASGMRAWLCTIPAGVGLATLKASAKLLIGVSPRRSGVRSAGNGPAMRSAIIGAHFGDDLEAMRKFVEISTLVTHTDDRAVDGAYLVALAAAGHIDFSGNSLATDCWRLDLLREMLDGGRHPSEFACHLGLERGVSGFVAHTVPVALYCSLWAGADFAKGITAAASLGGDTDTLCAIVGGILGAQVGFSGLPEEWVDGLWEWPRSVTWMRQLGTSLADGTAPPRTFWPAYLVRSPLFIATVLAHGARRLAPPY